MAQLSKKSSHTCVFAGGKTRAHVVASLAAMRPSEPQLIKFIKNEGAVVFGPQLIVKQILLC